MNTYYVELNFCGNQVIDTGIAISQGDYGQVQFSIATKKDGQYISDAQSAEIVFKLSNGYIVNGTMTGAGGLYSYIFQGNELQSAGKTVATVILHYADGRVSSESFTFSVRYNPLYDRGIEAGPYITQLESIREQAQGYVDYLEILISQLREDVEATALTKADLQNDFLQTQPGFKALDAAVGSQIVQTSHIDNNLTGTDPTHVLASPQGKALKEEITQLKSDIVQNSPTYIVKIIHNIFEMDTVLTDHFSEISSDAGAAGYFGLHWDSGIKLVIGMEYSNGLYGFQNRYNTAGNKEKRYKTAGVWGSWE